MNFILYPQNFQLDKPIQFQTMDSSAKARELYDFLAKGFQHTNFQIGYQLLDGSQGYMEFEQDLKQFFDANAQLFIVQIDQGAIQGIAVQVFKIEGDQSIPLVSEQVDPNLQIGQYLIQLRQQYNIIADSVVLYDHQANPLTDDQNIQFGMYIQYPVLNLTLLSNQQLQPILNNNVPQNQMIPQGMNPSQISNQSYGVQGSDQQLVNNQMYYGEFSDKPQNDSTIQPNVSLPNQLPMQQLQPIQQIINQQVVVPIDQKIQMIKESFVILKNITLYFDPSGEFITYKYHHPIQLSGSIRKSQSTSNKKFSNSSNKWSKIHENKYEFAELDEYSFAVKWEGGNSSRLKIKQQ